MLCKRKKKKDTGTHTDNDSADFQHEPVRIPCGLPGPMIIVARALSSHLLTGVVERNHCLFMVRLFALGIPVNFREIVELPTRLWVRRLGFLVLLHGELMTRANCVPAISALVPCHGCRLAISRQMTGVAPVNEAAMRARKLLAPFRVVCQVGRIVVQQPMVRQPWRRGLAGLGSCVFGSRFFFGVEAATRGG
jgi:hypothetical protein